MLDQVLRWLLQTWRRLIRSVGLMKLLHVALIIEGGARLAEAWLILQVGGGGRDSLVSHSLVGVCR